MAGLPPDSSATTQRIAHIALDAATLLRRNADVEQDRREAIYDQIEENT